MIAYAGLLRAISLQALEDTVDGMNSKVEQIGEVNVSLLALEHTVGDLKSKVAQVGDVNASLQALTKAVDGTRAKVDELMGWKNRILGGAVVLGAVGTVVLALLGVGFKTFYDVQKLQTAPATSTRPAVAPK